MRKSFLLCANNSLFKFRTFENLNLDVVSNFGQFYKIRRASDFGPARLRVYKFVSVFSADIGIPLRFRRPWIQIG